MAPAALQEAADALASVSENDKWNAVKLTLLFNAVIGFGFFIGSLFLDSKWGSGASFQAVFTSMIHEVYTLYVLHLVNRQDIGGQADFLGGINVMMNVLLLQTAALWGDLAGGLNITNGTICIVEASTSERFIAVVSTLLFIVHLALTGMVVFWRNDLVRNTTYVQYNQPADFEAGHHSRVDVQANINASPSYQSGGHPGNQQHPKRQFIIDDEDADAEL